MTILECRPNNAKSASERTSPFSAHRIRAAVDAVAAGRTIVLIDDLRADGEADLVFAASTASTSSMAFMVRHASGMVAVALEAEICTRLRLPAMPFVDHENLGSPPTVTVDSTVGVTTGISAKDRATTARSLADPRTRPDDLSRPGHIQPLRVDGLYEAKAAGRAEAAVELVRMAGSAPAAVLCELVSVHDPRRMARAQEARLFAARHGLIGVGIGEILALGHTWVA